MNKHIKRGIALVLVLAVGGGGFYAYKNIYLKGKQGSQPQPGGMSLTSDVSKNSIINTVTATGTVMLNDEVEVYAEGETNKIKEFHVEEGDTVTAGQLLVTYDTDDTVEELENKIRDTQREIENAELNIKSIQTPATDSELQKLQNEITSCEKSLADAQNNVTSTQTNITQQNTEIALAKQDLADAQKTVSDNAQLLAVGGITQDEYDSSVTSCNKAQQTYDKAVDELETLNINLESAKQSVTTAQNSLELAKTNLEETQNKLNLEENQIKLKQQQLTLQGLEDTLADAQKDLSEVVYSTYSTVNGVVTEVCVDEGTYTEENTVMLKIADLDDLIVSANIEEYDAPLLALGQKVTMTSDGLEGKTYTGSITEISATASSASSNMGSETVVPIEISVDNPDGILKQNYNLDLEIVTANSEDVLCVPAAAIGTDGKTNESYVYKVENDTIKKTVVEVGATDDTNTEILSGLNEGDKVVASMSDTLTDGASLQELMASQMQGQQTSGSEEEQQDDRDNQFGQGVQPGGAGGSGFGGGMPQGGGR